MLDHMRHPQQTWLCKMSDCWSEKRGCSWRETLKWLDLPEGCIMLRVICTEQHIFFQWAENVFWLLLSNCIRQHACCCFFGQKCAGWRLVELACALYCIASCWSCATAGVCRVITGRRGGVTSLITNPPMASIVMSSWGRGGSLITTLTLATMCFSTSLLSLSAKESNSWTEGYSKKSVSPPTSAAMYFW